MKPFYGYYTFQIIDIHDDDKTSRLETCFEASQQFLLSRKDAIAFTAEIMESMIKHWLMKLKQKF